MRFRIRTLLILMTLLALVLGGFYNFVTPYRNQSRAFARLEGVVQTRTETDDNWLLASLLGDRYTRVVEVRFERNAKSEHFGQLSDLPFLKRVFLELTKIEDADLQSLRKLKHLEKLSLRRTRISDAGLRHLSGLSKLQVLSIRNTAATPRCLDTLPRSLRRLEANERILCKENAEKLKRFPHLKLRELRPWGEPHPLAEMTEEQAIAMAVSWLTFVGAEAKYEEVVNLNVLKGLGSRGFHDPWVLRALPSMTHFKVSGYDTFKYYHLDVFAGCKQLRAFEFNADSRFRRHEVDDWWILKLSAFPQLEELALAHWQIEGWSIKHLAATRMRRLNLSNNKITSENLDGIERLESIASLDLSGNDLDDSAVDKLGKLKSLSTLKLKDTSITKAGFIRLKQMLPETEILQ